MPKSRLSSVRSKSFNGKRQFPTHPPRTPPEFVADPQPLVQDIDQILRRQSRDISQLAQLCESLMTELAETNLKLLFVMNQFGVTIKPKPGAIEIPGQPHAQEQKMNLVEYFARTRETFIEKLRLEVVEKLRLEAEAAQGQADMARGDVIGAPHTPEDL